MNTPSTDRFKKSIKIAATALALSASLAGANAVADPHGYQQKQDRHNNASFRFHHHDVVRLNLRVRDHGPENLALGRMIRKDGNINPDHYRLKAVVTSNGRFSNGYASLRTGKHRTGRYFLGSRQQTRIPAPSGAADTWRLRLGPGTAVKSVTVILEPRRHGLARTKAELNRSRAHQRLNAKAAKQEQATKRKAGKPKALATDNERNRRYVISDGKRSNRTKHS